MSTARILFLCVVTVLLAASASAQTTAPRFVAINSADFSDEKAGITRLVVATKAVNAEFLPVKSEIDSLSSRIDTLQKEIDTTRNVASPSDLRKKADQRDDLELQLRRKQNAAQTNYEKRYQAVVGPILQDIGNALVEFARSKGYGIVFDISKDDNGLIPSIGDDKLDVTKDFIAFFNAKPIPSPPK